MSTSPPIQAMIMAMDRHRLIGRNGGLPWHIPGELAYFKSVTMGKPIIMGRKTYESIGRPLPGRTNIVITSNTNWSAAVGVLVVASLAAARHAATVAAADSDEILVIGGALICRAAMPATQRLYLTYIDAEFEGDTYLDSFAWADWQQLSRQEVDPATTSGISVAYLVLERRKQNL